MKKIIIFTTTTLLLLLLVVIFIPKSVFSFGGGKLDTPMGGYQVFKGTMKQVVPNFKANFDTCKVQNTTNYNFFVPTATSDEWSHFSSSTPVKVSGDSTGELLATCCGDRLCRLDETCATCPTDCGACAPYCGDGICNNGETSTTCFHDCGQGCCKTVAGTSQADPSQCNKTTEDQCSYYGSVCNWTGAQCVPKQVDEHCSYHTDLNTCEIKNDKIGCKWDVNADPCVPYCGDGVCNDGLGETHSNCPSDCPDISLGYCGDGICDAQIDESCSTCPTDCGYCDGCGDGTCSASETCTSCPRDCNYCNPDGECCTASGNECNGSACYGQNERDCSLCDNCTWIPEQQ